MEIITTKPSRAPRMVIYSEHKIGKSTFASETPGAVFIPTEDGLDQLTVQSFPLCETFDAVIKCFEHLRNNDLPYKTVVIDSLDWLERLIWEDICREKGWEQLGDGPYGAGYKIALNRWQEVINHLTYLNNQKKMMVVLLAHAKITKFEDPERDNYDRYELDLHEKASRKICEFVDIIGFMGEKVVVVESKEGFVKTSKGKGTGERVLNLNKKAAFEAGNRYGLPDQIKIPPNGGWLALATELRKAVNARRKAAIASTEAPAASSVPSVPLEETEPLKKLRKALQKSDPDPVAA